MVEIYKSKHHYLFLQNLVKSTYNVSAWDSSIFIFILNEMAYFEIGFQQVK